MRFTFTTTVQILTQVLIIGLFDYYYHHDLVFNTISSYIVNTGTSNASYYC